MEWLHEGCGVEDWESVLVPCGMSDEVPAWLKLPVTVMVATETLGECVGAEVGGAGVDTAVEPGTVVAVVIVVAGTGVEGIGVTVVVVDI